MLPMSTRDCTACLWHPNRKSIVVIASIYVAIIKDVITEELREVVRLAKEKKYPLIIACDSNSHAHLWGMVQYKPRSEALVDFILQENLVVCNIGTKNTFEAPTVSSIIDLTLTNTDLFYEINSWKVGEEELKTKKFLAKAKRWTNLSIRAERRSRLDNCLGTHFTRWLFREKDQNSAIFGASGCLAGLDEEFKRLYLMFARRKQFFSMTPDRGEDFRMRLREVGDMCDLSNMREDDCYVIKYHTACNDEGLKQQLIANTGRNLRALDTVIIAYFAAKAGDRMTHEPGFEGRKPKGSAARQK